MDNGLNSKTQIWADGYSFMEVTETLLMALGIRTDDPGRGESEPYGAAWPTASIPPDSNDTKVGR